MRFSVLGFWLFECFDTSAAAAAAIKDKFFTQHQKQHPAPYY